MKRSNETAANQGDEIEAAEKAAESAPAHPFGA
jgi:hypothetical protein